MREEGLLDERIKRGEGRDVTVVERRQRVKWTKESRLDTAKNVSER